MASGTPAHTIEEGWGDEDLSLCGNLFANLIDMDGICAQREVRPVFFNRAKGDDHSPRLCQACDKIIHGNFFQYHTFTSSFFLALFS
jgi:hypothetical protein